MKNCTAIFFLILGSLIFSCNSKKSTPSTSQAIKITSAIKEHALISVNISSTVTSPSKLKTIPIKITFSADVSGFSSSNLAIVGATASNFKAVSGSIYTIDLINAHGTVTVNMAADQVVDSKANPNLEAKEFSITVLPSLPGLFSFTKLIVEDSAITVNWENSIGANSYTLKYGTASKVYTKTVATDAKSPTTITNLKNGTLLFFSFSCECRRSYKC